ncbi:pyridoxamine 5'-phosphate oxidase family protein [Solirubrobacter soli]|uniref:pyridoxamine 5'-phosphate oxidase family protein n=1 Tax=Solirubrobacter soli TaxID=363832 RepID=UPI00041E0AE3|nr:pyridoxamine 5'-phosphate oxidase family protein [Solirubrobacter soli]
MPRSSTLEPWEAALLDEIPVGHLGLLDEGGNPRVQPITFARVERVIVSAIDDKPKRGVPARIERLRKHPRAALTVDRYDADWTRLAWVQLLGDVTVEDVDEDSLAALAARYPAYRETPPRGPLLKLRPERVLSWRWAG